MRKPVLSPEVPGGRHRVPNGRVTDILASLKWATVHGCFDTDPDTQKLREIDVIAHQSWERGRKTASTDGRLLLVIECKSAAGYHVLLSPIPEPQVMLPHRAWSGEERKYEVPIAQALGEEGLTGEQITQVITASGRRPKGYRSTRALRAKTGSWSGRLRHRWRIYSAVRESRWAPTTKGRLGKRRMGAR
jgi:hypothetical protein